MSPKVHYPLEQTCLSDNLVIYIGEPDSNESPTCQAVQGQGKAINPTQWPSAQAVASTGGKLHRVGNRCGAELALIPF